VSVALATVLHDPSDRLLGKISEVLPEMAPHFAGIGVLASVEASAPGMAAVRAAGAIVEQELLPAGIPTIGRRRRGSLAVALRTGATHVLSSDIDHVMRWWERHPEDFRAALAEADDPAVGVTIIGRGVAELARTPAPLRETEGLVNRFYEARTGRPWDLLLATRVLRADVAAAIVERCDEDTIATDVAWPLFAEGEGATLRYRAAPIDYETADWYATGVSERDAIERDPKAWALRCDLGRAMFEAFDRWAPPAMRS
jgi:hypothetical protein